MEGEIDLGFRGGLRYPDGNIQIGLGKRFAVTKSLSVGLSGNFITGLTTTNGLYAGGKTLLALILPAYDTVDVGMSLGFQYVHYPFVPNDMHYLDFLYGFVIVFR